MEVDVGSLIINRFAIFSIKHPDQNRGCSRALAARLLRTTDNCHCEKKDSKYPLRSHFFFVPELLRASAVNNSLEHYIEARAKNDRSFPLSPLSSFFRA